jgi:hypothetical protein
MSSKHDTTWSDYLSTWTGWKRKMHITDTKALRQMMNTAIGKGVLNSATINNSPLTGAISPATYYGPSIVDYIADTPLNIRIYKVSNGFLVQSSAREGDLTTAHVATTIEEVNEIITTQLVVKKMEGK